MVVKPLEPGLFALETQKGIVKKLLRAISRFWNELIDSEEEYWVRNQEERGEGDEEEYERKVKLMRAYAMKWQRKDA